MNSSENSLPNIMQKLTDVGWDANKAYLIEKAMRAAKEQGYLVACREILYAAGETKTLTGVLEFIGDKLKEMTKK